MAAPDIDPILEKLARDVEAAVHAMYRGEVRQLTARARTDSMKDLTTGTATSASTPTRPTAGYP